MITLVHADDWQGVYRDGKLVQEEHRISSRDLLRAAQVAHEEFEVDYDWLVNDAGHLPELLSDIPKRVRQ